MRALRFHEFGDPAEVLHIERLPDPAPGPEEVLVQVQAASLNPSDVKNVQGKFGKTTLPRIPGRDSAGIVVAGDKEMIGREIWTAGGDLGFTQNGSHSEYIVIPKKSAREKPKSLSMMEAASLGINYITAYPGLIEKARLKDGETLLVTGATGGVGNSAAKIAKLESARVIGVDRHSPDPEKARLMGIDITLNSESDDIVNRVKQLTEGAGVDVVFDCVGGPLFEAALNSLGTGGRQVNITLVGDRRVCFDLLDFYHRRLTLFGIDTAALDIVACGNIMESLRPGFEDGRLTPPEIARTCSPDEIIEAYRQVY
ncbi:MAG: zinc-binding alcohol dehydrogenase family protein [Syntrophobacteraceae bacterium]|jgi:NADPH:quinone reductase-like Zn-dependent oxidoreductase